MYSIQLITNNYLYAEMIAKNLNFKSQVKLEVGIEWSSLSTDVIAIVHGLRGLST